MTETYPDILVYTSELDRFGVPAVGNYDTVGEAIGPVFARISAYIDQTAEGSARLIDPPTNEAYGHGRVWSIAWAGGPFGWAEAYAVSEGASNTHLVAVALSPCVLSVEALD